MFFMGAGFMLLETKGVVHMALLFGSTWLVNSIVFFAILVMILCSNLWVLAVRPRAAVAVLSAARRLARRGDTRADEHVPQPARRCARRRVVRRGVRAGVLRGHHLRARRSATATAPDIAFGSNIGGAILGGLSENLSLLIGFNNLGMLALLFYGMSAVTLTEESDMNRRALLLAGLGLALGQSDAASSRPKAGDLFVRNGDAGEGAADARRHPRTARRRRWRGRWIRRTAPSAADRG